METTVTKAADSKSQEKTVLFLLAIGCSTKQIAAELQAEVKTILAIKIKSMQRLKLNSRIDILKYAERQGWVREEKRAHQSPPNCPHTNR
jgi:DNA-binding NarL/FixJ family response regulator